MNDKEEKSASQFVRPRGRMMDFAPRSAKEKAQVSTEPRALIDGEKRRRELAKREVRRREEIHRQIEQQREQDIIAKRRAIAARKDLARRLEAEREENAEALAARERELELQQEREERARKRALIEQRALKERQRILAERRAKLAREELEARREAENRLRPAPSRAIRNPHGSHDPLQKPVVAPVKRPIAVSEPEEKPRPKLKSAPKNESPINSPRKRSLFKRNKVEKRLGSVEDFEAELNDLEHTAKAYERDNKSIRDFVEDNKTDDYLDDIDEIEKKVKEAEQDTSKNNDRYVLGGRSPFINTEVEKRPLSGGTRTMESTAVATLPRVEHRPKARGRYVPYNEPIPHKNIYARSVAKEKENREFPTMVVGDAPKGSKASLIIAIILTIILGATVGAIAYLALFQ